MDFYGIYRTAQGDDGSNVQEVKEEDKHTEVKLGTVFLYDTKWILNLTRTDRMTRYREEVTCLMGGWFPTVTGEEVCEGDQSTDETFIIPMTESPIVNNTIPRARCRSIVLNILHDHNMREEWLDVTLTFLGFVPCCGFNFITEWTKGDGNQWRCSLLVTDVEQDVWPNADELILKLDHRRDFTEYFKLSVGGYFLFVDRKIHFRRMFSFFIATNVTEKVMFQPSVQFHREHDIKIAAFIKMARTRKYATGENWGFPFNKQTSERFECQLFPEGASRFVAVSFPGTVTWKVEPSKWNAL